MYCLRHQWRAWESFLLHKAYLFINHCYWSFVISNVGGNSPNTNRYFSTQVQHSIYLIRCSLSRERCESCNRIKPNANWNEYVRAWLAAFSCISYSCKETTFMYSAYLMERLAGKCCWNAHKTAISLFSVFTLHNYTYVKLWSVANHFSFVKVIVTIYWGRLI